MKRIENWFIALVAAAGMTAAHAQYPTHAVTLVVPFAAGGPTDVVARTLGAAMVPPAPSLFSITTVWPSDFDIAANYVAKANPDGYTIFIHHNGMATATGLYRNLPYNPLTDFEYIGQVADVPMTMLARKDFPPDGVKDLVAYVRANKEKINLANAGLGAVSQLCGMLFMQAIGAELTTIPFSGTAPAMVALLGGQVDILCDQTTQTIPQIKAGKVKFYGVTTRERIKALPDAPTLDEQGLKDFEIVVWHGVYAPKGTPKEALDKLNAALRSALKDPDVAARFAELGAQIVPEAKQTPAALRDWLKAEIDKWQPLIRKAGVYAD
jgi:tripartite-type tricarboxylate transporter receptor subunit TctC